MKENV